MFFFLFFFLHYSLKKKNHALLCKMHTELDETCHGSGGDILKNSPLPTSQLRKNNQPASLPDVITTPAFMFPPFPPSVTARQHRK